MPSPTSPNRSLGDITQPASNGTAQRPTGQDAGCEARLPQTTPCRIASAAAAVLEDTSNLARILVTCRMTVRGLM